MCNPRKRSRIPAGLVQVYRGNTRDKPTDRARRCVLPVLVTILADSRARLRQLRIVIKELEQDDVQVVAPRPEPQHIDTSATKAHIWAKKDD